MSEVGRRSNRAPRRRGVIFRVGVVLGGAMGGVFSERACPGRGQWDQFTAGFKGDFCRVERAPTAGKTPWR